MRLCIVLSRLTGWGLADVRGVGVDVAEAWINAAMDVERAMTGKH